MEPIKPLSTLTVYAYMGKYARIVFYLAHGTGVIFQYQVEHIFHMILSLAFLAPSSNHGIAESLACGTWSKFVWCVLHSQYII